MPNQIEIKRSRGVALVIVLIIFITLTSITASFLYEAAIGQRKVAHEIANAKALWIAEAGLQDAVYRVKNDISYRNSPIQLNGILGDGSYSVDVVKNANMYNLVSTATVNNVSRKLTQVLDYALWATAFNDYGLWGGSITIDMFHTTLIDGDVYVNGNINLNGNSRINGYAYAQGGITGNGNYLMPTTIPDPLPTIPSFDTAYYNGKISTASTYPAGNQTYNSLNLAGGIVYVNGDVTISNGGRITGPGTLVLTGKFTLSGSAILGTGSTVISGGTLDLKSTSMAETNTVFYSSQNLALTQSGVLFDGTALITPGDLDITQSITFNGIVYAGGSVAIRQSAIVRGAVVAGTYIELWHSAHIIHSVSAFPSSVPIGLEGGSGLVLSQWNEIPL